jgi:hypothetical protein
MRVQIPAYTDRWMMGDRFGDVVKISRMRPAQAVRAALLTGRARGVYEPREVAHVKLDVSGKTLRFVLDDCTVVS